MSYNSTTWQTGDTVTADKLNNIEQQLIMLDAAQSGGTEVVIDNTLTQTGQAADAKKTGDEISAIKADLGDVDRELNGRYSLPLVWEQGNLNYSGEATNSKVIRTGYFSTADVQKITASVETGFIANICKYSGNTDPASQLLGYIELTSGTHEVIPDGTYSYIRFKMQKTESVAIVPAEGVNLSVAYHYGDSVKADLGYLFEDEQVINSQNIASNNNTALVNNNDGTYTIGTTDYGNTTFGNLTTLTPGDYYLFGVPNGIAYLSPNGTSSQSYANRVFENTSNVPKKIHIDTEQQLWVCFRSPSKPTASYTISPSLYFHKPKVYDTLKFMNFLEDGTDLNNISDSGVYVLLSSRSYTNSPIKTGFLHVYKMETVRMQIAYALGTTNTFLPSVYTRYGSGSTIISVWRMVSRGRKTAIKMACFGDSIMYGQDGNASARVEEQYRIPSILAYNLNIETTNYGVGSQGYLGLIDETAYDNISSKDLTQFNAMIMCYGVNDGYKDLGEWNSTDENTIMGQFNKIVAYVFTQNPSIRLIVIAPYNGRNVGTFPKYWYGERSHPDGYVSRQTLSDTLKQACEYYNIPYIEQKNSPINCYTIQSLIGTDGVHPSLNGYLQLGAWLSGEVGKLIG